MTSATLFREGPDLDELLAELDEEHAGRVRVVDVEYGRDGGVMGFFARRTVGVHYVISDADAPVDHAAAYTAPAEPVQVPDSPLEALLQAAEAADEMVTSGRPAPAATVGDNVEFARMLLDIAAQKAAERQAEPAALPVTDEPESAPDWQATRAELLNRVRTRPVGAHRATDEAPPALAAPIAFPAPVALPTPEPPAPVTQPVAAPVAAPIAAPAEPPATATAPAATPHRTPLTLRRQLAEIGVPLDRLGDENGSAYEVIERLVDRVVPARRAELNPGELLVVAGPAVQAQAEAARLCAQLRLDPTAIRTAGCGADPIRNRRQAMALELDARGRRGDPCIVVVATDSSDDFGGAADLAWAADIIGALDPDQLVLVVDAASRAADVRRTARALGRVTSLAVVAAARAASPAGLWELDLPIASLDGAPATRGRWAALLIDRLAELDGH